MDFCVFCKINNNEIPSKTVYEDEFIKAFHDINPAAKVHVVIIPKLHIRNADDINSDNSIYIEKIFEKIPVIAKQLGISGNYRIINNCGENAGQTVFHLHFHLLSNLEEKMGDLL